MTPSSPPPAHPHRPLILGSTSRYRHELLSRLRWPFEVVAPEVDETPLAGEVPKDLATRLALAKARAVAAQFPQALVIGSDQVADLQGQPLGKPGTHERARAQLRQMSGQTVVFQTALAVVCQASGFEQVDLAPVQVQFRDLSDAEIEHYLAAVRQAGLVAEDVEIRKADLEDVFLQVMGKGAQAPSDAAAEVAQ